MTRRRIEKRLEALEDDEDGGQPPEDGGIEVLIQRHAVDEDGNHIGVHSETRCYFNENGNWVTEEIEP